MNTRDVIVRIVMPAEKPQPPQRESVILPQSEEEENLYQKVLNILGMAAIAALGVFLVISFFNLGSTVKDILILISIPVTVGLIARYVIF
jgi:ACR3 family arsenite efflux pump ArsB